MRLHEFRRGKGDAEQEQDFLCVRESYQQLRQLKSLTIEYHVECLEVTGVILLY